MGLGSITKLKSVMKGGLLRKIGKFIGKASSRLHKVRVFIFQLKSAQINRIAGSANIVASQVDVLGGRLGTYAQPIGAVAGGISTAASSAADVAAQANGFMTALDERLFRLGRQLYKRCYRILKLCSEVLGTISKFAKRIRKVIRIIRLALKVGKWIAKLLGGAKLSSLIAKAEIFLERIEAALLIVQRSTGQLAAICRDLSDQLTQMNDKYDITDADLIGLDGDDKIVCIPDRLYPSDEFCDPDWEDDIDNSIVIEDELRELDFELDSLELEVEDILDRRAPQTKNECLRFLADLDCVDKLEAIVNGLENINSSDADAQEIINRAKGNITSAKNNIESSVGILDFENVGFGPWDTSNANIIDTIGQTEPANSSVRELKEKNIQKISVQSDIGIEYNDNNVPEYLNYRQHIKNDQLNKLTGDEVLTRYKQGISLRNAVEFVTPEQILAIEPKLIQIGNSIDNDFQLK